MKFHIGAPIETPGFTPDDTWRLVKASGPVALQLQAVPVALSLACFMGMVWFNATSASDSGMFPWDVPLWWLVLIAPVTILLHELLHALALPRFGLGPETYLCFWPEKFLPYVLDTGRITRARRFIVLVCPFVVLTIVPVLLSVGLENDRSYFTMHLFDKSTAVLALVSIINAVASGPDVLIALKNWRSIPPRAQLQGSGWNLYYKLPQPTLR